ncbi:MAG: hypothetical protein NTY98_09080 [Verrucomicrobia bacterium]|nr:hypothetical protein [Verrucomicrobiota bacterium]
MRHILLLSLLTLALPCGHGKLRAEDVFKTLLPPPPIAALSAQQEAALAAELAEVTQSFQRVKRHARAADIDIFLKAVRYALEFHEWYDAKPEDGVEKARALLAEARVRISALKKKEAPPWLKGSGFKVLGFYSKIDDSPQPYGVEIPKGLAEDEYVATEAPGFGPGRAVPAVCVWLHDREETLTDLRFVHARLTAKQPGLIQPKGAIVIHPFGRYCNGWKFAGETDVMECLEDALVLFRADWDQVALAGFGMGGTGAWHLGAHHAERWACVHAGAGFVDVAHAVETEREKTPWYEQKLQGMYDLTGCAGRFSNLPLICYSGELDPQRRSMEHMLKVLGKEGLHPTHLRGAGMGHAYDPASVKDVQAWMETAVAQGRESSPRKISLQTRSWRHSILYWLQIQAVHELWEEGRIDAEITGPKKIQVKTEGVRSFNITHFTPNLAGYTLLIDDQEIKLPDELGGNAHFTQMLREGDLYFTWHYDPEWKILFADDPYALYKEAGSCMDDLFFERFIFVLPDGPGEHPAVDEWVRQESQHAIRRWRSLMRGDPKVMTATEYLRHAQGVHEDDQQADLVLWGDAKSNPLIATLLKHKLTPLKWDAKKVQMGAQIFDAATHVPLMLFPNSCIERKRLVDDGAGKEWTETAATGRILINSGLTFREAHDRSDALQNPKLPDWAILDITQPANEVSAGKVVAADFFDDRWRVKP